MAANTPERRPGNTSSGKAETDRKAVSNQHQRSRLHLRDLLAKKAPGVMVNFDRNIRRTRITWWDGPAFDVLYTIVVQAANNDELPGLDIAKLLWDRQTTAPARPSTPPRKARP